jgi:mono/diheme cytochrome c family protein
MIALLAGLQLAASPRVGHDRRLLAPGSVWDSVFTMAQAGRGESTFKASCASCHGDSLKGVNDAPPLAGPDFLKTWDGNALSSLANRINNDMPSDNPGTLTRPQVIELVAYVLKYNGFPAGQVDLPSTADSLATIKIMASKP